MRLVIGFEANVEKCSGKILSAELNIALSLSLLFSPLLFYEFGNGWHTHRKYSALSTVVRDRREREGEGRHGVRCKGKERGQGRFLLYQWETLCCQKRSRFSIEMDGGRRLYQLGFYCFWSLLTYRSICWAISATVFIRLLRPTFIIDIVIPCDCTNIGVETSKYLNGGNCVGRVECR